MNADTHPVKSFGVIAGICTFAEKPNVPVKIPILIILPDYC
jgi:hypothetical protein